MEMKTARQRNRFRRRILGFTAVEVLAVATIVGGVEIGAFTRAQNKAAQTQCISNLSQIGKALEMYVMANGEYPRAAFYPADPAKGEDSIRVLLDGIPESMWVCPAMPDALREKGLTFVYNDTLGGQRALANPDKRWVLIEMTCVSKTAPHAHPDGYNVLFASGKVITTKRLPKAITDHQQAQLDRMHRHHHDHHDHAHEMMAGAH